MRVLVVVAASIAAVLLVWLVVFRIEPERDDQLAAVAPLSTNEANSAAAAAQVELDSSAPLRAAASADEPSIDGEDEVASAFSSTLRVEVVDRRGQPASNVTLVAFEPHLGEWEAQVTAHSDALGVATMTIEHAGALEADKRWRIATSLVACEPEFLELSLASPAPEALRLAISDHATIEVQTHTAAGEPLESAVWITLSVADTQGPPFGIANGPGSRVFAPTGLARFERIGVDFELELESSSECAEFADRTVEGPREPDAPLAVALQIEAVFPLVRARLITPPGVALDKTTIRALAAVTASDGRSGELRFSPRTPGHCDDEVEFNVHEQYIVHLGPWVEYTARRAGHPRWIGRASLGPPTREYGTLERDVYEVGDVTLREVPYFVCGQVVDADGDAVEQSIVTLSELDTHGVERLCAQVRADGEGAFEIDTTCDADGHRIHAGREDHEPGPAQIVRRGAVDIELRLGAQREYGAVRGSLLLPAGADCDSIRLDFASVNADSSQLGCYEISSACEFVSNGNAPGDYTLLVRFEREVLLSGAPFTVVAGATTELPPIDLRDRVHALAVTVTNTAGDALPDAWVQVLERDGSGGQHAESDEHGLAILTTLQPRRDLVVMAAGYRTQLVKDTASGARIALVDGITARLHPPELGADAHGFSLRLQLERDAPEEELPVDPLELTLTGPPPLDVRFSAAGKYRVTKASWRELATGIEAPIEWPSELLLDVPKDGGALVFEWPLGTLRQTLPRARPK